MTDDVVPGPRLERRRARCLHGSALAMLSLLSAVSHAEPVQVRLPMTCSRGPGQQWFDAAVTLSGVGRPGETVTVRIDSMPSGTIRHFGLHHIRQMTTDYRVAKGATYVEGSLRLVPGTGTANVAESAHAWHDAAGIHVELPARVANKSSYLPPSVEFKLTIDAAAPAEVSVEFARYEVTANVVLLGDLRTTCQPSSAPAAIGSLKVEAPPGPARPSGDPSLHSAR